MANISTSITCLVYWGQNSNSVFFYSSSTRGESKRRQIEEDRARTLALIRRQLLDFYLLAVNFDLPEFSVSVVLAKRIILVFISQSVTACYYKVRQLLLQSATGITKRDGYCKVRQNSVSVGYSARNVETERAKNCSPNLRAAKKLKLFLLTENPTTETLATQATNTVYNCL